MECANQRFRINGESDVTTKKAVLTINRLTREDIECLPSRFIYITSDQALYAQLIVHGFYAEYFSMGQMPRENYVLVYTDETLLSAKALAAGMGRKIC